MIDRRSFLAGTGAVLLAVPLIVEAQPAGRVVRVGVPIFGPRPSPEEVAKAVATDPLWLRMKELGWVEGQNLVVERRWSETVDQLRADVAALVQLPLDVLVAGSVFRAQLAQAATKTIPIVAIAGGDLVANGLVTNLAKPGGNLTGLPVLSEDLVPKQLELLKTLIPDLTSIAYLAWPQQGPRQQGDRYGQQAALGARTLGIKVHPLILSEPVNIADAFREITKNGDRALLVFPSGFEVVHRREVIDLAARHRLPAIYPHRAPVQAGGLMSYGVNYPIVYRRAAEYIDKILRGTKPGDLPIEQPTKIELVINLKTAKALGLTIPPALLARADEVID